MDAENPCPATIAEDEKDAENPCPATIAEADAAIRNLTNAFEKTCATDTRCYPFLFIDEEITKETVDRVFDDLQTNFGATLDPGRLVVIVASPGGDINAAYNLALLFRHYGSEELTFVVPRWAKSAATLLVCAGDKVMMTQVAELGPLDPQITEFNPFEQRIEQFSPLHIESTLELIRNEFSQGNGELAQGLLERLQFPLSLGSFTKSLDVGKQYANKLLGSRMLKNEQEKANRIANSLVEDYANHGFCINIHEASTLGLAVELLSDDQLHIAWGMHKLARKRAELQQEVRRQEMEEQLRNLPPGILDNLRNANSGQPPHPNLETGGLSHGQHS